MKIFVKIGALSNKGDMMMLLAILDRYTNYATIAVKPQIHLPLSIVNEYGIRYCVPNHSQERRSNMSFTERLRSRLIWIWNQLPTAILKKFNYVSSNKIDLFLDASGFAYGETWGFKKTVTGLSHITSFKNSRIVFMPQSFGTFEDEKFEELLKSLIQKADLICARDLVSYQNIAKNTFDNKKVRQFPDFTFDVGKIKPNDFCIESDYVVIIPSHRVEENDSTNKYFNCMVNIISIVDQLGFEPILLLHDSIHDKSVAEELKKCHEKNLQIVEKEDVRELRWVIESSKLVVSSRFHGLINSLTLGVPAIGLGWTHKFDQLMGEYEMSDYLIKPTITHEDLYIKLKDTLLGTKRQILLDRLSKRRNEQYMRSMEMWKMCDKYVKKES